MKKLYAIFGMLLMLSTFVFAAEPGAVENPQLQRSFSAMATNGIVPEVTEYGKISLSQDGLGTLDSSGTLDIIKPAGATVRAAYMAVATMGTSSYTLNAGDIKLDGTSVSWDKTKACAGLSCTNYWGDVTSIVKSKIDSAAAGPVSFTVSEQRSGDIDGSLLVVIFDDPTVVTDNTIVLLFGAQAMTGDTFNVGFSDPIDTTDPNFNMEMALGISYSYQGFQYSIIDVNSQRLSTSSGGQDDGTGSNGALFTVGGVGDDPSNPADPMQTPTSYDYDDELYTLNSYVEDGDTQVVVNTRNPSNDDNILYASFVLNGATAVFGEGIVLSPASAENLVGTDHTVTATVQDDSGEPVVDRQVTFEVLDGPNKGTTYMDTTDANGKVSFTWSSSEEGVDVVVAKFIDSQQEEKVSNKAEKLWYQEGSEKYLDGHVYVSDINSGGVSDVEVFIECGETIDINTADSVMTDENGMYTYTFYDCESDYVTASIGGGMPKTKSWFAVEVEGMDLAFADIDFNVPEFSTIGAALGLIGAGLIAWRRRK